MRHLASRCLFAVAFACFGWIALAQSEAWIFNAREGARLAERLGEGSIRDPSPVEFPRRTARDEAEPGRAFGIVELPRLGITSLVAEGSDDGTLGVAVGRLP